LLLLLLLLLLLTQVQCFTAGVGSLQLPLDC